MGRPQTSRIMGVNVGTLGRSTSRWLPPLRAFPRREKPVPSAVTGDGSGSGSLISSPTVDIRDIRCTTCFAPLGTELAIGDVVTCKYCRTPLRVSGLPAALLQLTPASPSMPGWSQHLLQPPRWSPGPPAALIADVPGEGSSWDVVRSVATFDDFDVTATLRLSGGNVETTHGGLKFRRNAKGLYQFAVSTSGKLALHYLAVAGEHVALAAWVAHPAVRSGRGDADTLRVVCTGDRIRAFVNGTTVASVRDASSAFGTVGLFAQSAPRMTVACSSIVVREPAVETQPSLAAAATEGGTFDLVLLAPAPGNVMIQSIKALKEATQLGLRESKEAMERPGPLRIKQARAALEGLYAELKRLGCSVEIRPSQRG